MGLASFCFSSFTLFSKVPKPIKKWSQMGRESKDPIYFSFGSFGILKDVILQAVFLTTFWGARCSDLLPVH